MKKRVSPPLQAHSQSFITAFMAGWTNQSKINQKNKKRTAEAAQQELQNTNNKNIHFIKPFKITHLKKTPNIPTIILVRPSCFNICRPLSQCSEVDSGVGFYVMFTNAALTSSPSQLTISGLIRNSCASLPDRGIWQSCSIQGG